MASIYSGGTTTNVGSAPTGNANINAMIGGTKWGGGGMGTGATVTFSFPTNFSQTPFGFDFLFSTGAFNYGNEASTGQALDATQRNAARSALQKWANVANLNFNEIADTPDTDNFLDNSSVGDIRFAESNDPNTAHAYYPSGGAKGGDIWFNKNDYNSPVQGNYAYHTFMHEIGHALGLEHPHENDDGDTMGAATDANKFSIMSYKDHVGDTNDGYGMSFYPTTPMLLDVQAIQALYGANWGYNNGNNTYSWAAGAQIFECIWDGGGNDTIDASNQTQSVILHLTSGVFSTIGSSIWNESAWVRDNLVIAYNAVIENATGTAFNDEIYGNTYGNTLRGGGGNDVMRGSLWSDHNVFDSDTMYGEGGDDFMGGHNGNDSMYGGDGNDSVIGDDGNDYLSGGSGDDWVVGDYTDQSGNGNDTMYGDGGADRMEGGTGNDYMVGGNNVASFNGFFWSFADESRDEMYGQAGDDTMYGGAGNDYMDGGTGSDYVNGQNGDDTIYGGSGNDTLVGDNGNDYLSGDDGADAMYGGSGNDTLVGGWNFIGFDTMDGGDGDDVFHVDGSDVVVEGSGASSGNDLVYQYTTGYTLANNVERMVMVAGVLNGNGNAIANTITGNASNNTIDAGLGADTVNGGDGDDTIWGANSVAVADGGDTLRGEGGNDTIGGSYGNDNIDGGIGNDALYGDEGSDTLRGGDGDDLLRGDWGWGSDFNGNDTLDGGNGNDSIYGGAGNDTIIALAGNDFVDGGSGVDTVVYTSAGGATSVDLSLVVAQNTLSSGLDTLLNLENVEGSNFGDSIRGNAAANLLRGYGGNDTILGGFGDDTIDGGVGDDILRGEDGNDRIIGGLGNDTIDGGNGIDTADYSGAGAGVTVNLLLAAAQNTIGAGVDTLAFIENVTGSAFADTLTGSAAANVMNGGAGNDAINGGVGNDTIEGGAGDDILDGSFDVDTVSYASATAGVTVSLLAAGAQNTVGAGLDTLLNFENVTGSAFNDTLSGNNGINVMNGGAGNDVINAGLGNDIIDGGTGNDTINGGDGVDTVTYASSAGPVNASLTTNSAGGAAGVDTFVSIEQLIGSNFADVLAGDALANRLDGGAGNDVLRGMAGNDTLVGGGGNDRFEWTAVAMNSLDMLFGTLDSVTDFNAGDFLDFTAAMEGQLLVNGVSLAAAAANVAIGNAFNATTNVALNANTLWIDLDNNRAFSASDMRIALVGGAAALTYDAAADAFRL